VRGRLPPRVHVETGQRPDAVGRRSNARLLDRSTDLGRVRVKYQQTLRMVGREELPWSTGTSLSGNVVRPKMKRSLLVTALTVLGVGAIFVAGLIVIVGLMAMGSAAPKVLVILIGLALFAAGVAAALMAVHRARGWRLSVSPPGTLGRRGRD